MNIDSFKVYGTLLKLSIEFCRTETTHVKAMDLELFFSHFLKIYLFYKSHNISLHKHVILMSETYKYEVFSLNYTLGLDNF